MNIVDAVQSRRLEKKLDNGLTEIKELYDNGQLGCHYFKDENNEYQGEFKRWRSDGTLGIHCFYENGKRHGEYKSWYDDGTLEEHCFYENDKIIKDYLR